MYYYFFISVIIFAPYHRAAGVKRYTEQGMIVMAPNGSQKCWGIRPRYPFGWLLTAAEVKTWILWVRQWLTWPVCRFPGQDQQPRDDYYWTVFTTFSGRFHCDCRCWRVRSRSEAVRSRPVSQQHRQFSLHLSDRIPHESSHQRLRRSTHRTHTNIITE